MKELLIISLIAGAYWYLSQRKASSTTSDKIDQSWITPSNDYIPSVIQMTMPEAQVMVYQNLIMKEGTEQGIDPAVIASIIYCESKGIPTEKTYEWKVLEYSYGLMQILGTTAYGLGFTGDKDLLLEPAINIYLGTKYLVYQLNRYIDMYLTGKAGSYNPGHPLQDMISAYNAGHSTYNASSGLYSNHDYVYCVVTATYRFRKLFNNAFPGYNSLFPAEKWMI